MRVWKTDQKLLTQSVQTLINWVQCHNVQWPPLSCCGRLRQFLNRMMRLADTLIIWTIYNFLRLGCNLGYFSFKANKLAEACDGCESGRCGKRAAQQLLKALWVVQQTNNTDLTNGDERRSRWRHRRTAHQRGDAFVPRDTRQAVERVLVATPQHNQPTNQSTSAVLCTVHYCEMPKVNILSFSTLY